MRKDINVNDHRYRELIAARTARLNDAFKVAPDTSHPTGHVYK